jgi:transcriptional regulator with XRE-family HTH domain
MDGHSDSLAAALEKARLRRRLPDPKTRRALRQRAGLPQAAVARAVGVDRATISRWESGEREPGEAHLRSYIETLGRLAREAM